MWREKAKRFYHFFLSEKFENRRGKTRKNAEKSRKKIVNFVPISFLAKSDH